MARERNRERHRERDKERDTERQRERDRERGGYIKLTNIFLSTVKYNVLMYKSV